MDSDVRDLKNLVALARADGDGRVALSVDAVERIASKLAEFEEATWIIARVVSAANKGVLEGDDGFVFAYQVAVGPIHAAIPFLHKQGLVVAQSGEIRGAPSSLDDAIAQAKVDAGLDPAEKHQPRLWVDHLPELWRRPFWARQLEVHDGKR